MGLLNKLTSLLTRGVSDFASDALGLASKYFPPDMSPEQTANYELEMRKLEAKHNAISERHANVAARLLNERIAQYEGTAKELTHVPVVGPLIILLRSLLRPFVSYFVVYMDYMVFSGGWSIEDPELVKVVWLLNAIVLLFWFGERSIRNALPVVTQFIKSRGPTK